MGFQFSVFSFQGLGFRVCCSGFRVGERWTVTQAEFGEQGDPLMPLLFSIGIQGALEKVSKSLKAGEHLCAFFDDIYLVW